MKTLGVIGGLGPESTIEYYRTIIALYRERAGDGSYPEFVINNLNLEKLVGLFTRNDLSGATEYLVDGIAKLADAGAQFGLISANTPHVVFDEIQAASPIPLISIVEAACAAAQASGFRRLALFGTRFTMEGGFYSKVFMRQGLEIVCPEPSAQEYIHEKYMNELLVGKFLAQTRAGLLEIIDQMREKHQVDAVLLAGTELPLILRDPVYKDIPLLDTMQVHAEAAVTRMLS